MHPARWSHLFTQQPSYNLVPARMAHLMSYETKHLSWLTEQACLRMVPPFVTAHTFYASWDIRGFLRNLPTNTTIFLHSLRLVEKEDPSKSYQNPKRKLGVTTYFSEIIELKFGKKLPYSLWILMLF